MKKQMTTQNRQKSNAKKKTSELYTWLSYNTSQNEETNKVFIRLDLHTLQTLMMIGQAEGLCPENEDV